MRKNTEKTFKAWYEGRTCKPCASIWTDGKSIFSYGTRILERDGGKIIFNRTDYSKTTTVHQNGLHFLMTSYRISPDVIIVDNS